MYSVGVAPSAERDIERVYRNLQERVTGGLVHPDYPDTWYEEIEEAIRRLREFPHSHPYAPEREAWGRDVRNILLRSGYRILFQVHGNVVWAMRVRHQRQDQLQSLGPDSGFLLQ